jgi:hypothetical protein
LVGAGEIPADAALRFRAALMERSPKTRIVTNARSSLQGGSALLWLLGDSRTINDARLYFRRTTLSEYEEVDNFLATVFSKSPEPAESSLNAMEKRRVQRGERSVTGRRARTILN